MGTKEKTKRTKTAEEKDSCRVVTPKFRVSYPHVFKPQAIGDAKPKYSITMLFPKDRELMGASPNGEARSIKSVIVKAKKLEFGDDKSKWPKGIQSPITDGDDEKFADKVGYKGHWVIKAITSEDQRPVVVDRDMSPLTEPADLYPGCYARASIFAYVWEYMGKRGVGFILDHVQKLGDGKPFGGKKPVEQVFSPIEDEEDESEESDDADEEDFT